MKPHPRVREQFERAQNALEILTKAEDVREAYEAWTKFLQELDRVWNKAEAHFSRSQKWHSWNGKFSRPRKSDPLLRYLCKARNSEEHGIDDTANARRGYLRIDPITPGAPLHIKRLAIENGRVLHADIPTPFKVEQAPAKLELLDVTNRDVVYKVPEQHLGKPLASREPADLGELALRFYETFLNEAEKYFYD